MPAYWGTREVVKPDKTPETKKSYDIWRENILHKVMKCTKKNRVLFYM